MKLINEDAIDFAKQADGNITISKEKIEAMPTAYNVDNVIERLEKEKIFLKNNAVKLDFEIGVINGINNAIRIVKEGWI